MTSDADMRYLDGGFAEEMKVLAVARSTESDISIDAKRNDTSNREAPVLNIIAFRFEEERAMSVSPCYIATLACGFDGASTRPY